MSYAPDPYGRSRRNINEGFRVGLIGAIVASTLHLLLPFFAQGAVWGDIFAWLLQLLLYVLVGRSAAQRQYDKQQMELNPLEGVVGAGTGAALITSLLTWLFILVRSIIVDAAGNSVLVEPISLCLMVFLDIVAAIGLGTWSGRSVARKYEY